MNCLCNYVHQRPVLGVQGEARGPPEALLPHLVSPASLLLGLRKEVGDPLKGRPPSYPPPPHFGTAAPGRGGVGWFGVWASPVTASAHLGGCAFDIKIKTHQCCLWHLHVDEECAAEVLGQADQQPVGPGADLLGKRIPSLSLAFAVSCGGPVILGVYLDSSATCIYSSLGYK